MYPFVTMHPTDYKNLLRVYLDAVLQPLLSEQDFRQEGHRLEYSDPSGTCRHCTTMWYPVGATD